LFGDAMIAFGRIRENTDGLEDPTVKFQLRSVPHNLSLVTSIDPVEIVDPNSNVIDFVDVRAQANFTIQ